MTNNPDWLKEQIEAAKERARITLYPGQEETKHVPDPQIQKIPETAEEWVLLAKRFEITLDRYPESSVEYPYEDKNFNEHVIKGLAGFSNRRLAANFVFMNPGTWVDEIRVRLSGHANLGTILARDFLNKIEAGEYKPLPDRPLRFKLMGMEFVIPHIANVFEPDQVYLLTPFRFFHESSNCVHRIQYAKPKTSVAWPVDMTDFMKILGE